MKTFIPLKTLLMQLENDDNPAHPDKGEVTPKSIREAWPKMKEAQAKWLYAFIDQEADKYLEPPEEEDPEEVREKLDETLKALLDINGAKCEEMMATVFDKATDVGDGFCMTGDLGSINDALQEIVFTVKKVQKEQQRLGKSIEQLNISCGGDLDRAPEEDIGADGEGELPVKAKAKAKGKMQRHMARLNSEL